MKLKIILLALPVLLLLYVFLIRDYLDHTPGIGGGGYDLTKMYTLIAAGVYLLILNFALLLMPGKNGLFLLIGVLTLIVVLWMAARSF